MSKNGEKKEKFGKGKNGLSGGRGGEKSLFWEREKRNEREEL